MAAAKLLNLIAVSTLAILAASFGATPVSAVSVDTNHLGARSHAHAALAKKRRSDKPKRCKPRPSSAPAAAKPTTTKAAETTKAAVTTKAAATTTKAAAATTTTKASSGSSSGSTSSGSGAGTGSHMGLGKGKASLGWAQDDDVALEHFANAGKIGAVYDWAPYVTPKAKSLGLRPCPMLWGEKQISQFTQLVKPGYADCVLGFNEPNQEGQSNIDPHYAAQLWKQYINPLKDSGYTLVSPAPTNAPSGKTWLQTFFSACSGCHFDAVAVHFYGTDPQAMISFIEDIHNTFNLPVWPTEFACHTFSGGEQCTKDGAWKFFQTVKPWMDNTPYVQYYFAFGTLYDLGNVNENNRLLGSNGYPTDLGYYYIS